MNNNPLILALETSGRTGSAAIARADNLLAEHTFSTPVRHSSEIFPAINRLLGQFRLQPKEITEIYVSIGPGSFTGLRIAATFAKVMHLANRSVRIVAVDTLDCIAANASDFLREKNCNIEKIASVLDAKRGQFFIAAYQRLQAGTEKTEAIDGWHKIAEDCLMTAEEFVESFVKNNEPVWLLGEGLVFYRKKFEAAGINFIDEKYWTPKASKLHLLGYKLARAGQFADPLSLQPKYLRGPDVKLKKM